MIQLHVKIVPPAQISAQVDEAVNMEGAVLESQTELQAEVKPGAGITAKLLPAALLVACLTPTIALEARMLPPEWTDGTPANFITADGYYIRTADGYLLCVQEI